jgi:glycosyltransferase involved in cell wall biosynthesis
MKVSASLGIIALVPDDWDGIVTLRHQVVRRLAKYCSIVWLEPPRNWREFLSPTGQRFLAGDRWSEPIPSMQVLKSGLRHPVFYRPEWLAAVTFRSRLASARRRLIERGADRIALYLWRDTFADALDLVPHDFSCYHIDDEYDFSDEDRPISTRELNLLKRVDQVIIHSQALLEKKGNINRNTELIPNGVDFRLFSTPQAEPPDVASIPHPRIGYAGVIKRQLDLALLVRLAQARPEWSFVLVGPVMNVAGKEQQIATLRQMSNVHFLGAKPASALARYVQHFDVCLMCYDVNRYTRYIYPLKLHEYLASGRPAVSARIPAVLPFERVVPLASDDAEWLSAIERALGDSAQGDNAAQLRQAVARESDFDVLVERIATLFTSTGVGRAGVAAP